MRSTIPSCPRTAGKQAVVFAVSSVLAACQTSGHDVGRPTGTVPRPYFSESGFGRLLMYARTCNSRLRRARLEIMALLKLGRRNSDVATGHGLQGVGS